MVCTGNPSYLEAEAGGSQFWGPPGQQCHNVSKTQNKNYRHKLCILWEEWLMPDCQKSRNTWHTWEIWHLKNVPELAGGELK